MGQERQDDSIGRRVAAARKLANLTQHQLAQQANISVSLVRQVEQGRVPASPAFVAATARALAVPATALMAQPYEIDTPDDRRVHSVIPALRRELARYRLPLEQGVYPRTLDDLAKAVSRAGQLRQSASLDVLGAALPGLLAELRAVTFLADESDGARAYGLLAETYAAAGQVCWKLGYGDLSALVTERIEWAAAQANDPLAVAAADFYRAGELIAAAEWRGALTYLEGARERIVDRLDEEAGRAIFGVLHLKSGLAASRIGDAETSDAHLAEARRLAAEVTPGSDHYRLAFDKDSVNIWSVALAVERYDSGTAVTRAHSFVLSGSAPRERVGHHWIDLARAYQLQGDRDRTLATLHRARQIAPQQTRYHPQVRETVLTLAESDRRRSESLAGFARWAGIVV